MHLLASLNAGFAGAANGTAEIYVRGSSTRATWYSDFEGTQANSSGANITLDAYGSALAYVNQLVDVVIKDSTGSPVRTFGDGVAAPNTEVRSLAFTGRDYTTAASAAGNPTTLQAMADLWLTNSGAIDWKVLIGGVATTLQNAFGVTTGMWFNVQASAYGAVGDGVTNDQTAIAAALAAAVAAGGGTVFFPKGTYLISTAIEWDHKVNIVGMGADLSIITTNSGSNARIFTWTAGTLQSTPQLIYGLSFSSTQANTGSQLYATVAVNHLIRACNLGKASTSTGTLISYTGADSFVWIEDTRLNLNGTANTALAFAASTRFLIQGCRVKVTNAAWVGTTLALTGFGFVTNTIIDQDDATGAGSYGIENLSANDHIQIVGCSFVHGTSHMTACFKLVADSFIIVEACDLVSDSAGYEVSGVLKRGSRLQDLGREDLVSTAAPAPQEGYGLYQMESTTTVPTVTMPTKLYPGQKIMFLFYNTSAGAWASNVTWSGAQLQGTTDTSAAIGEMVIAEFVLTDWDTTGTYVWLGTSVKLGSA